MIALAKEKKANDKDIDAIKLKNKYDWIKEIKKMKAIEGVMMMSNELPCSPGSPSSKKISKDDSEFSMQIFEVNRSDSIQINSEFPLLNHTSSSTSTSAYGRLSNPFSMGSPKKIRKIKKEALFYGRKGLLAFLDEFMSLDKTQIKKLGIIEEKREIFEYYKKQIIPIKQTNKGRDTISGTLLNAISNSLDPNEPFSGRTSELRISKLVGSLLDLKEYQRLNPMIMEEYMFIAFNNPNCYQFLLLLGLFYSTYDPKSSRGLKELINSFNYLNGVADVECYFPINLFKSLIEKLSPDKLEALLPTAGDLKYIIEEQINKYKKQFPKRKSLPNSKKLQPQTDIMKTEEVKFPKINFDTQQNLSIVYLNTFEEHIIVPISDPKVFIITLLNDLIIILKKNISKKTKIFSETAEMQEFEAIKVFAYSLTVFIM